MMIFWFFLRFTNFNQCRMMIFAPWDSYTLDKIYLVILLLLLLLFYVFMFWIVFMFIFISMFCVCFSFFWGYFLEFVCAMIRYSSIYIHIHIFNGFSLIFFLCFGHSDERRTLLNQNVE